MSISIHAIVSVFNHFVVCILVKQLSTNLHKRMDSFQVCNICLDNAPVYVLATNLLQIPVFSCLVVLCTMLSYHVVRRTLLCTFSQLPVNQIITILHLALTGHMMALPLS